MTDFADVLFNVSRIVPWALVVLGLWQVLLIKDGRTQRAWTSYGLSFGFAFLCFVVPAFVYAFDNADGSIHGDVASNLIGSLLWGGIAIFVSGGVGLVLYAASCFVARKDTIVADNLASGAVDRQARSEKEE